MTTHTSGAADLPEALDAIADSQYLAGVTAGWNAAQANDPNAALRKIHESRAGYLKPLRDAQLAALAAGQAVAPADGWLQEGGLLYRLTDERRPCNRDEIRVTMAGGSRSTESCSRRASELLDRIRLTPPAMDGGDTAMLDWLDADANEHVFHIGKTWYTRPSYGQPYRKRPNLRDAIRAAWAAQKEGE